MKKNNSKNPKEEYKKDTRNLLIYVAAFAVMIIIVVNYPYSDTTTPSNDNETTSTITKKYPMPDEVAIRVMGKRFIERQITTNSVEFDGTPKVEINSADSTYYMIGYVTYVNTYNAPMKSLFTMKVKFKGGEEGKIGNYELQSLQFEK